MSSSVSIEKIETFCQIHAESYGKHQSEVKLQVSLARNTHYKSIYICVCVVHHTQSIAVISVQLLSKQTQAGPICDSFKLGVEPVG